LLYNNPSRDDQGAAPETTSRRAPMSFPLAVLDPIGLYEEDFRSFVDGFCLNGGILSVEDDLPGWLDARPHLAHATDRHGRNLLHRAIWGVVKPGVVRCVCERFPHLARVQNVPPPPQPSGQQGQDGRGGHWRLPLHDVVCRRHVDPDDLRALVEAYPKALRERNFRGDIPLHCALIVWEVDYRVVHSLVTKDPESVRLGRGADNHHQRPLWMAFDARRSAVRSLDFIRLLKEAWPGSLREKDWQGRTPLRAAVEALSSPQVLSYLVEQCPAALRMRDNEGRLPLHFANTRFVGRDNDRGGEQWVAAARVLIGAWPDALHERSNNGELPVHSAAELPAVDLLRLFVRHFPGSMRERAGDGATPLHRAVTSPRRRSAATRFFLQEWPESVRETDAEGRTPLHVAARLGPNFRYRHLLERSVRIGLLLDAWPDAVRATADDGSLPLHYAAATPEVGLVRHLVHLFPGSGFAVTNDGRAPVHCAVDGPYDRLVRVDTIWLHEGRLAVLGFLLYEWPDSIRLPCNNGLLPVHYAALRTVKAHSVRFLVERWPESAGLPTADGGSLPVHLAVSGPVPKPEMVRFLAEHSPPTLLIRDSDGSLPLHLALTSTEPPSKEVVLALVEHGPRALSTANGAGSLPVHLAAARPDCPLDVLMMLVEAHPAALAVHHKASGLLPFQMAAANSAELDVVFYLLSKWPPGVASCGGAGGGGGGGGTSALAAADDDDSPPPPPPRKRPRHDDDP
jgi:ankyrin repeat protein